MSTSLKVCLKSLNSPSPSYSGQAEMIFDIISIFPALFKDLPSYGVTGRAVERGLLEIRAHDLRAFTSDRHRTTDDAPYGGGSGMVMKVEPVAQALEAIGAGGSKGAGADRSEELSGMGHNASRRLTILTTPQGAPFTQSMAREFSRLDNLVIVCGRYEGVDERIRSLVDMEVSIGDYILTGGEIPALVIMDAVSRLVTGVLGSSDSKEDDSFSGGLKGLLEYPQYTRPPEFRGQRVPEVLLSGDHARIERFRRKESLRRTLTKRPELMKEAGLTDLDREILEKLKNESEA